MIDDEINMMELVGYKVLKSIAYDGAKIAAYTNLMGARIKLVENEKEALQFFEACIRKFNRQPEYKLENIFNAEDAFECSLDIFALNNAEACLSGFLTPESHAQ